MTHVKPREQPKEQLQMVWPRERLQSPPAPVIPDGYELRLHQPGDEEGFFRLMDLAGFKDWNQKTLDPWLLKILPDGWFLIFCKTSGALVATTMATHNPSQLHPFGGELGWVAGHPAHAGKGLGLATCAAVTARFLRAGYHNIYLKTDPFRLPAIKTYLRLGYLPFLFAEGMESSWKTVCANLNWPFTPAAWPKPASHSP